MFKVGLFGTCNETSWRDEIIPLLKCEYFNPVITDRPWTEEDRLNEIKERKASSVNLYVLTPCMTGLFSIAEMIDDSNKRPDKTVLYIKKTDITSEGVRIKFLPSSEKYMDAIKELARTNGVKICDSIEEAAEYLNSLQEKQ